MTDERRLEFIELDKELANAVIRGFKAHEVTNAEAIDLLTSVGHMLLAYAECTAEEDPDKKFVFVKID